MNKRLPLSMCQPFCAALILLICLFAAADGGTQDIVWFLYYLCYPLPLFQVTYVQ